MFSEFQIVVQTYFFVAFGYDVIEASSAVSTKQLQRALHFCKSALFTSVLVPTTAVSYRI
jgi:hypothetical protein